MNPKTVMDSIVLVKQLAVEIITSQKIENISLINSILLRDKSTTEQIVLSTKNDLLGVFVLAIKSKFKLNEDTKIKLLNTVSIILTHNKLTHDELLFFFNIFGSLLTEIYVFETCSLRDASEEYRTEVMNSMRLLFDAATPELCFLIYTRENAVKICKAVYTIAEILKSKCRKLRTEGIKCLMSIFRAGKNLDVLKNVDLTKKVADCLAFFLPGVVTSLASIVSEGEKVGVNILKLATDALGRVSIILLKNTGGKSDALEDAKQLVMYHLNTLDDKKIPNSKNKVQELMELQRTPEWFDSCDKHLINVFDKFNYLAHHPSDGVRLTLAVTCSVLIQHCYRNLRRSSKQLLEILIIMSYDENAEIMGMCQSMFEVSIIDHLVAGILFEKFHQNFSRIPTVFNGIDTKEQIDVLRLTTASIDVVGHKIKCNDSFKEFQRTLLYLCEIEIDTSTFTEVISHEDLDSDQPINTDLWKNFKFMKEESVRKQFDHMCNIAFERDLFPVLSDYLISVIMLGEEKVEAIYLMNRLLNGISRVKPNSDEGLLDLIMPVFQCYIDSWDIPLKLDEDECTSLKTLRLNILQAALLCEGVGLMALHAKGARQFRPFLHQCLYKVLVRAASSHYQLQAAAAHALRRMAFGLGFPNVTQLLNENMDFFLFNIECGLRWIDFKEEVFDVMEMVMKYGDVSILQQFTSFVKDVLVQTFDKFHQNRIDSYLRVFRIFLRSLMRWFKVYVPDRVFKTKEKKREDQLKDFKIGGLNEEEINDFSDDIMGKTAEEMYKEDMEKKKVDLEDEYVEPKDEAYEKPQPPRHIQITVDILKRSLHFLPSKDANRKLLVLEILRNGVEIIRDFEDELLPIVHLIWSPLVDRFKEVDFPVILNYSFQLLLTLARVSKDFIRNRTAKDVLPSVLSILTTLSKRSYLKDKGSSYRYSLDYKLQLLILENMIHLVTDIDLLAKDVENTLDVIILYLSDKQPVPLQAEALKFFKLINEYDPVFNEKINTFLSTSDKEYEKNLNLILCTDKNVES